jgi:eukaryotic-like serine/threonine-protein kinase
MHALGDLIANRYVLCTRIAHGGMGIVFRARQCDLDRVVAIKVVRPELADNPRMVARFRREAIALSRVVHHNVVFLIEYGETDRGPFLVLPYLRGRSLGASLAVGSLSFRRIRTVIDQLLAALGAAHARGVVHGDVKTDNILIDRDASGRDHITLIDFGLARTSDQLDDIDRGRVAGTPEYVAPEVIGGCEPTPGSDLYAVGVVLYELLTGTPPFTGKPGKDILLDHVREPIIPPSVRCPDRRIPEPLERIVIRALAKDPRARFASAAAFRDELAASAGDPTLVDSGIRRLDEHPTLDLVLEDAVPA